MSTAGMVTMFLGVFIICTRAPLIIIPRTTLRAFEKVVSTETGTRGLGVLAILIFAVPMIWAGVAESSGLAEFLLIFGIFILALTILALLIFPRTYMSIAESVLPPEESDSNLFGWRLLGVVSVIIGGVIFAVGIDAL